ncbi:MAG TPA: PorV/PorQ family protein [Ignavibacteriales bacterium]|nr:PorV/PorQ family protein [Ignavibacteriales bacterium]
MMKKILFIVLPILAINTVQAQTVISKYAGEFLNIGVGGRALGMGGAFAAVSDDITAAYWNPAGLANINYPQFSLMHAEQLGNLVNYNYGAAAMPFGSDMSFGISLIRVAVDDIPDTRNAWIDRTTGEVIYDPNDPNGVIDPTKVTYFNNADYALYLTAAKRHSDKLSYGASVKLIMRSLAEYDAYGIGFDIGAIYSPIDKLFIGANIQDITTTLVAWDTGRNELISPTVKVGAAYMVKALGLDILPAIDIDTRFENRRSSAEFNWGPISYDLHFGFEASYKNVVAVRAGYNEIKQYTLGAGLKLPKLNIDYSFAQFTESELERLPDTHRISLILTLENPKFFRSSGK